MVFDSSIIFGFHLFKSVALSNIFFFFIGGETVDDFDFVFVFSLLCSLFSMPNFFLFSFLGVIITVQKNCLHAFNIFCFLRFLEKLQNG